MKLLRSEVPAGVGGTLNFTLCEAQYFTAATPLLHLGVAQTSLNIELKPILWYNVYETEVPLCLKVN
ncbi:MAG: hypothetical protein J6L00_00615 [Clostridia bacterium]|nr:hypothetical protein [Clostridia bacterium]